LYKRLRATSFPISIFSLSYSLAPKAKYPTQLKEASLAYSYLINTLHLDPRCIIVGGDSAGGNLALQLLRHIAKPHPQVRPLQSDRSNTMTPGKCILISPWVTMDHTSPSATRNKDVDILVKECGDRWAWNWKGGHVDEFTDPITVPPEEWDLILPLTLVISGQRELIYDDIQRFCENLRQVRNI
jgi:acetyl esterase/lipase